MYKEEEMLNFLNALVTGGKVNIKLEKELNHYKLKTGEPEYTLLGAVWTGLDNKDKIEIIRRIKGLPEKRAIISFASLVRGIEVYGKNTLKIKKRDELDRKQKAIK